MGIFPANVTLLYSYKSVTILTLCPLMKCSHSLLKICQQSIKPVLCVKIRRIWWDMIPFCYTFRGVFVCHLCGKPALRRTAMVTLSGSRGCYRHHGHLHCHLQPAGKARYVQGCCVSRGLRPLPVFVLDLFSGVAELLKITAW